MSAPTLGPWTYKTSFCFDPHIEAPGKRVIASLNTAGKSDEEVEANGLAMAAGLDLLAALQDLQLRYASLFDLYVAPTYSDPSSATDDLALALTTSVLAIAKATGKLP